MSATNWLLVTSETSLTKSPTFAIGRAVKPLSSLSLDVIFWENTSSTSSMTPFYVNKGFHPRMSFGPDTSSYSSTRTRLEASKAEDISQRMQELLDYGKSNLKVTQEQMKDQVDKHRRDISYNVGDMVWVSSKDMKTGRPSKSLEDRMLGPYKIIKKIGTSYRLELPLSMKRSKGFHVSKLRPSANDPLPG